MKQGLRNCVSSRTSGTEGMEQALTIELPSYAYVDTNCCNGEIRDPLHAIKLTETLRLWQILNEKIKVLLDIFHWMRLSPVALMSDFEALCKAA